MNPSSEPRSIRLEASSFCQLRCPSCPTTQGLIAENVGSGFLRFEDFRRLLDEAPTLDHIELSNYGEIFLNPEIYWIIRLADARGVKLTANNGVNLNNVKEDVLEALVQYRFHGMTCSIDGASNETYQQYRVRGDYDRVIENIEAINRCKKKYHSPYPYLKWQFVVFGHNEHEIETARVKAAELDMEFYTKLSWDETISPVRDAEKVRKATGNAAASRSEYEQEAGTDYMNHVCNQLWDLPQINWNGDVLGCCINYWGRFGGNAFEDGLAAVVNSPAMRDARAMLTGHAIDRSDLPCNTCFVYRKMKKTGKWMQRPAEMPAASAKTARVAATISARPSAGGSADG